MNTYEPVQTRKEPKKLLCYDFRKHSVFVGLNALANETLISRHKVEHPRCIWMHVVGRKGPHVVLCLGDPERQPDLVVLRYAAGRALKFTGLSKGKVIYAPLEDVFKPEQSTEGIYRTWRTETIEI